ncbi:hypothetical protein CDAR_99221 [Caerostris darwini]|uniref:Uncharacterized protein n=1 Tax=Caerostris darwini TaxID=1538125 RepID=A0AAV4Q2B4_9ARAC|nr:hypothetical protein CDAR_99221 [Caerostris darwini]
MLYACFNTQKTGHNRYKEHRNTSTISFSHRLSLMAKKIATTASLSPQLRVIRNVSQCEICPALNHPGATSRPLAPPPRIQMALGRSGFNCSDLN